MRALNVHGVGVLSKCMCLPRPGAGLGVALRHAGWVMGAGHASDRASDGCLVHTSPMPPAVAQSPRRPLPCLPPSPEHGQLEVLQKLLAVDPELASARDHQGLLPVSLALQAGPERWEEAECLLQMGSYFPPGASTKERWERWAVADQLLNALALAGSPGSPQYAEIAANVRLQPA